MVDVTDRTRFMSLNNQSCMTRPTLISPDKYNQGLCFYSFMVSLDRCNEICNPFNDPSGRTCIPNETQDVNLNVCNMITIINELKTLKNIYHENVNVNLIKGNVIKRLSVKRLYLEF